VGPDGLHLVLHDAVVGGVVVLEDVEVVEPEVGQDLLELVPRVDGAHEMGAAELLQAERERALIGVVPGQGLGDAVGEGRERAQPGFEAAVGGGLELVLDPTLGAAIQDFFYGFRPRAVAEAVHDETGNARSDGRLTHATPSDELELFAWTASVY